MFTENKSGGCKGFQGTVSFDRFRIWMLSPELRETLLVEVELRSRALREYHSDCQVFSFPARF